MYASWKSDQEWKLNCNCGTPLVKNDSGQIQINCSSVMISTLVEVSHVPIIATRLVFFSSTIRRTMLVSLTWPVGWTKLGHRSNRTNQLYFLWGRKLIANPNDKWVERDADWTPLTSSDSWSGDYRGRKSICWFPQHLFHWNFVENLVLRSRSIHHDCSRNLRYGCRRTDFPGEWVRAIYQSSWSNASDDVSRFQLGWSQSGSTKGQSKSLCIDRCLRDEFNATNWRLLS